MSQNVTKNQCGKDLEQTKQTLGIIMKQQQHQSNPLLRRSSQQGVYTLQIQFFFGLEPVNIYTMENERAIARASASASASASAKKSTRRKHASRARAKEETSNLT